MKNQILKYGRDKLFTAAAAITSGDLVKIGSLIGVAANDVASGEEGVAVIAGVFSVPKEAEAIDDGTALYYKDATGTVTATAQGNTFAGYAWSAALLGDANVDLKLLF